MLQEGEVQCAEMKENRLQCNNPAIALVRDVPICRLHLNFKVGTGTLIQKGEILVIEPTKPEYEAEINKILHGGEPTNEQPAGNDSKA